MAGLGKALVDVLGQDPIGLDPVRISAPPMQQRDPNKLGKGQLIMGIIADALAGAAGRPGPFAAMMRERRQAEQEEAQWTRQRSARLEDYEAQKQIDQRYQGADISPMERDVAAWSRMTPEQKAAYQELQRGKQGDPDVFITLPNGQVYAGPRSGLAAAMMGGASSAPARPVGRLTPIPGGPTPPASGTFRSPR